jgi:hypothetical protein
MSLEHEQAGLLVQWLACFPLSLFAAHPQQIASWGKLPRAALMLQGTVLLSVVGGG